MSDLINIETSKRALEALCDNLTIKDPIMKGLSEIMGRPQRIICEYTLNEELRSKYAWAIGNNSEMTYEPTVKHEADCKCHASEGSDRIHSSIMLQRFIPEEHSLNFDMEYLFDQRKYFIAVLGFNGIVGMKGKEAIMETVIQTEMAPIIESFNYFKKIKSDHEEISPKRFIKVFKTTINHLQRLEKASSGYSHKSYQKR